MRTLEYAILLYSGTFLVLYFSTKFKNSGWLNKTVILLIALFFFHSIKEGLRWQMFPAYLVILFIALSGMPIFKKYLLGLSNAKEKIFSISSFFILGSFLFTSFVLGNLFPAIPFDPPTGLYKVGKTYFHFTDSTRPEVHTKDTEDLRSLWIHVWYPAERPEKNEPEPVFPEHKRYMNDLFQRKGYPAFTSSHLSILKSNSYLNAPIERSGKKFPVLLYSHGIHSMLVNSPIIEKLVSNGYVVFGISHTYESSLGLDQNGNWVSDKSPGLADFVNGNSNTPKVLAAKTRIDSIKQVYFKKVRNNNNLPISPDHELRKVLNELYIQANGNNRNKVAIWADDQNFVANKIIELNSGKIPGIFKGRLDVNNIGAFGLSFGGTASSIFCHRNKRCKAAASLDGPQYGLTIMDSIGKPILKVTSLKDPLPKLSNGDFENLCNAKPYYRVYIKGVSHSDFFCSPIEKSIFTHFGTKEIVSYKSVSEINGTYLLAFFNKYLKQVHQTELKNVKKPKGVEFRQY
ncbi:MAG: hypothetical protein H6605_01815 [Flavobacteriales bacterium]|nr:hypothetical protein [Flavobacteriales bacterium]